MKIRAWQNKAAEDTNPGCKRGSDCEFNVKEICRKIHKIYEKYERNAHFIKELNKKQIKNQREKVEMNYNYP